MSGEHQPVNYNSNGRVDVHEVEIKNINNAITRMENAIEKQSESMIQLSESMSRIAAQQELVTAISVDTRANSDRQYKSEERLALLESQMVGLPEKITSVEKKQSKIAVYVGIGVFIITAVGASIIGDITPSIILD